MRKVFPQTLRIEFTEREPLMIANLSKPYLIDEEGVLIAQADPKKLRLLNLPVLTGIYGQNLRPGDRLHQTRLRDILSVAAYIRRNEPLLQSRIVEWNVNGQDEVTAMLDTRIEVRFGDQAPLNLLGKLSALRVREELESARYYIDLRMERQIVYK